MARPVKKKRASVFCTEALANDKIENDLVAVTATAAIAATAFSFKIRFGRHATQFKGLAHKLIDGLVHMMHFLLRFQETARDRVAQHRVTFLFERGNFLAGQLLGALLLLLERLAFGHEAFVLSFGFVVRDELVDRLTGGAHLRLVQNRLAEFPGLLGYQAVLSRLHNHLLF